MGTQTFTRRFGLVLVLAGLVTYLASRLVEHGFIHGLFLGMTIALMIGAAASFGASFRRTRDSDGWLPSRDRS